MADNGLGVRATARLVPCNPGYVSSIASGRKIPSQDMAVRLDEMLGAKGRLASCLPPDTARQFGRITEIPGPRRPPRVIEALKMISTTDSENLDAVTGILSDLIAHYSQAVAMSRNDAVYDDLLSVRSFANSLLAQERHSRLADLAVTAGWLSSLLAASATDMGDHAAALVWCSDAERRGQDAGQPELLGWAALTRALIAYYQGQAQRSSALACKGQEVTSPGMAAYARLAAQEMRARAMLGDTAGMESARKRARAAMEKLPPDAATSGVFSIPQAADPPYTATSLLLAGRYQEAASTTRQIIETVYHPETRNPGDQPTNYARTLLILGLSEVGNDQIGEASAAGIAALECGRTVWPTLVLARRLDRLIVGNGKQSEYASAYHAQYRDTAERAARPDPPGQHEGTP